MNGKNRSEPGPDKDGEGKPGIQSIEIGMKLMSALIAHAFDNPPPMLKTLASDAGMAPAKAHRYMVSLVRSELVERDVVTGRYRLGPMARLIGLRAIQSLDVVRVASPRLPQFSSDLGFSVALAIWAYEGPTIIAVEEVRRPVTIGTRVGEVMPLLNSATGQVFGAWMPSAVTQDLMHRDIGSARRGNSASPVSRAEIDRIFERVRTNGVGATNGGLNPTVNALSAPIFDHRGVLVAALSTLGPSNILDTAPDSLTAEQLKAFAAEISADLGFTAEVATV